MRAITIREPYASLIAIGAKRIETRSWPAPASAIGQPIAIHAAKGMTQCEADVLRTYTMPVMTAFNTARIHPETGLPVPPDEFFSIYDWVFDRSAATWFMQKTRGCVIAVATLARCVVFRGKPTLPGMFAALGCPPDEEAFGDFTIGRYGWVLEDVRRLAVPVPARGQQGVWQVELPGEVSDACGKITGTAQKLETTAPPLTVRLSHQEEANA